MMKKTLFGLFVTLGLGVMTTVAQASSILLIDLTVPNQVTIIGTGNPSAVTASGGDSVGVYLENFYGGAGVSLVETLISGDLTNAENPSDGTPDLFRGGSGTDPGLNIWSWSPDLTVTFTAGQPAFVGSATWSLSAAQYADMVNGSASGNVYFPADTVDDLPNALVLGTYSIVPEPGALAIICTLGLGLLGFRKR